MYTIHMVRGMRVPVQNGVKYKWDNNSGIDGELGLRLQEFVNYDESRARGVKNNVEDRCIQAMQSWGSGPYGFIDEPEVTCKVSRVTH